MKTLAILFNVFIPGVGSMIIGKWGQGIGQIVIYGFGAMFTLLTFGFGAIIGIPMMLGAWIWGIITAAGYSEPIQVNIVNQGPGAEMPGQTPKT